MSRISKIERPVLAWFVAGILAGGLAAQAPAFTSPSGLEAREGNDSHWGTLFQREHRFQQIDDTVAGRAPVTLNSLQFRRDGERFAPDAVARTVDVTGILGHGDFDAATGTFASNYLGGVSTTAFTTKTVNFPDWTAAMAAPAAFDLVLPLDVPFAYDGVEALVWELMVRAPSSTGNLFVDREWTGGTIGFAAGRPIGTGCVVGALGGSFTHTMSLYDYGPSHPTYGMRLEFSARNAPADETLILNLGFDDPAALIPGLCATVHATPLLSTPLRNSTSNGSMPVTYIDVPYQQGLVGVELFTQLLSSDANQLGLPFALSEGRAARMPPLPQAIRCGYLYGGPTATTATLFTSRGVVCGFGD